MLYVTGSSAGKSYGNLSFSLGNGINNNSTQSNEGSMFLGQLYTKVGGYNQTSINVWKYIHVDFDRFRHTLFTFKHFSIY